MFTLQLQQFKTAAEDNKISRGKMTPFKNYCFLSSLHGHMNLQTCKKCQHIRPSDSQTPNLAYAPLYITLLKEHISSCCGH